MIADICGKSLLERVMMRLEMVHRKGILAIPDDEKNDSLERIGKERGWRVFRGSEDDVLGRFVAAARKFQVTHIIRATGDNPLVDPIIVREIGNALLNHDCARPEGCAPGAGVEGVTAEALFRADRETADSYDREHVMPYLYKNPDRYSVYVYPAAGNSHRLTVDTAEDIERVRRIFDALGDHPSMDEIGKFLSGEPVR